MRDEPKHAAQRGRSGRPPGWCRRARQAELDRVAARYAVAITPAMTGLIEPADPIDPIARQFVPDPAELEYRRRASEPTRSATMRTARSRASSIAIPTACC